MEYPDLVVRTAVFALLQQAGIVAYDMTAPTDAEAPYVLLLSQTNVNYVTKQTYGWYHSLIVSAVDVTESATGRERAEFLLNQVTKVLLPQKPSDPVKITLEGTPFQCWMIRSAGPAKDMAFTGDTETVYQKLVTLEFSIEARSEPE